jgi:hypothetical protein
VFLTIGFVGVTIFYLEQTNPNFKGVIENQLGIMKNYILIFFVICISCKEKTLKTIKTVEKDTIKGMLPRVDKFGNPIFAYKHHLIDDTGNNFVEYGEEIEPDTIKLKNNYILIIFPTRVRGKDSLNYRLVGNKIDTIFQKIELDDEKYTPNYYEYPIYTTGNKIIRKKADFYDFFILNFRLSDCNHFMLYDKRSGKAVFSNDNDLRNFDLKKELLIFDDWDDNYKKYIYDVNTKTKTFIDVKKLSSIGKSENYRTRCDMWQDNWRSLYVKRVSNGYYYLGGLSDCNPNKEFKLKIASHATKNHH